MNNTIAVQKKSFFPISSILFFIYVALYSLYIFDSTISHILSVLYDFNLIYLGFLFSNFLLIIAIIMLGIFPLFKFYKLFLLPFILLFLSGLLKLATDFMLYQYPITFKTCSLVLTCIALILMIVTIFSHKKRNGDSIQTVIGILFLIANFIIPICSLIYSWQGIPFNIDAIMFFIEYGGIAEHIVNMPFAILYSLSMLFLCSWIKKAKQENRMGD